MSGDAVFEVEEVSAARVVLRISGELDLRATDRFDEAIAVVTAGGHREVVADLRGSTFMDSTGLHALLRLRERARGCRMVLSLVPSSSPVVRTVFELAGVADAFEWVEAE